MEGRQVKYMKSMTDLYRQGLHGICRQLFGNKDVRLGGKRYFAELGLDGDFPAAGGAEKQFIAAVRDQFSDERRQLRGIGDPPKKNMSIQ